MMVLRSGRNLLRIILVCSSTIPIRQAGLILKQISNIGSLPVLLSLLNLIHWFMNIISVLQKTYLTNQSYSSYKMQLYRIPIWRLPIISLLILELVLALQLQHMLNSMTYFPHVLTWLMLPIPNVSLITTRLIKIIFMALITMRLIKMIFHLLIFRTIFLLIFVALVLMIILLMISFMSTVQPLHTIFHPNVMLSLPIFFEPCTAVSKISGLFY